MTNEPSSPALVPGVLPEGLFPELLCSGVTTQQAYETIIGITQVLIAAGQRGPQGIPGPAGPTQTLSISKETYNLGSGQQEFTITLPTGKAPADYGWILIDPTDSATPLSPVPALGYFSQVGSSQWRQTLTAPTPGTGWTVIRSEPVLS